MNGKKNTKGENMKVMRVEKEVEFDMGHRIPNHASKCRHPHGHRYRVMATVEGPISQQEGDSSQGMVIDFGDLKKVLMEQIHDKYDHGFMMWEKDPLGRHFSNFEDEDWDTQGPVLNVHYSEFIPTAENLAKWFFELVDIELKCMDWPLQLKYLTVWETPTSKAIYGVQA